MKGWTKIYSFDNQYDAELRKEILKNASINAVVVNAKDSLFLIGNIDLYVEDENEKKAIYILEQFEGLTKINSFILKKPIENFQKYIKSKGIETILKERNSDKYILENYELYINNELVENIVPYLTGEKITEWSIAKTCQRVRQTRYRVELLESYTIESFIIKKKDSNQHVEQILIYVENKNLSKAKEVLTELKDWSKIRTYDDFSTAELKEDMLGRYGIRGLIEQNSQGKFDLYVLNNEKTKAIEILNKATEWIQIQIFDNFLNAENAIIFLEKENIQACIVTISDSMFLIGGYAVYVEKSNVQKAIEIISNYTSGKTIE